MASLLNCLNTTVEWLTAPEALCLQSCSRQVSAAIQKIYQDMLDHTLREMEMQDRASQSELWSPMERGVTSPEAELRQHHEQVAAWRMSCCNWASSLAHHWQQIRVLVTLGSFLEEWP